MRVTACLAPVGALLIGVLCAAPAAEAQELQVDANLAERGNSLFHNKGGCFGCHAIGREMAGPDLQGVTDRRPLDWLRSFIKDPETMLQSDPAAQALLEQYNGYRMMTPRLTDTEVDALLHYIKQASDERAT